MSALAQKTVFITGASRGIGLAIALALARQGANIAVAAKTTEAHKKLPGTIYSACKEIEQAGGKALPLVVDVRSEEQVQAAGAVGRASNRRCCWLTFETEQKQSTKRSNTLAALTC